MQRESGAEHPVEERGGRGRGLALLSAHHRRGQNVGMRRGLLWTNTRAAALFWFFVLVLLDPCFSTWRRSRSSADQAPPQGAEVGLHLPQQQLQLAARGPELLWGLPAVLCCPLRLELGPQQLEGGLLGPPPPQLLSQVLKNTRWRIRAGKRASPKN